MRFKLPKRKREIISYSLIYMSVAITLLSLLFVVFWVFSNGYKEISWSFLTSSTEPQTLIVDFEETNDYDFDYSFVTNEEGETTVVLEDVKGDTTVVDKIGDDHEISDGTVIEKVDGQSLDELSEEQVVVLMDELEDPQTNTEVKLEIPGGGVRELILTTLFIVFWSLLFAIPAGLFAAIYLVEYDVNPKLNKVIHFAIDSLSGIPSIIFGLFGTLFFVQQLNMGQTLLAGILTVSIMLLPIVIKSIEETLIAVPDYYREASFGLGATKSQTLFKVIIPSALPGILVAVILSMGRVIGESAIFIFVVGTSVAMPSLFSKGASLTVYAYSITRETPNFEAAAAIGIVLFVMIFILNMIAKLITRKIGR